MKTKLHTETGSAWPNRIHFAAESAGLRRSFAVQKLFEAKTYCIASYCTHKPPGPSGVAGDWPNPPKESHCRDSLVLSLWNCLPLCVFFGFFAGIATSIPVCFNQFAATYFANCKQNWGPSASRCVAKNSYVEGHSFCGASAGGALFVENALGSIIFLFIYCSIHRK